MVLWPKFDREEVKERKGLMGKVLPKSQKKSTVPGPRGSSSGGAAG